MFNCMFFFYVDNRFRLICKPCFIMASYVFIIYFVTHSNAESQLIKKKCMLTVSNEFNKILAVLYGLMLNCGNCHYGKLAHEVLPEERGIKIFQVYIVGKNKKQKKNTYISLNLWRKIGQQTNESH